MSNYDLKSKLSQLESQLRQAERVNSELRSDLSIIERGVHRADEELENYNGKVRSTLDGCNGTMTSSHQRVIDAIEIQGEIEKMYVRFKQMELANKKIRAANNKKYYEFANYRTVRKLVQGIMDNLDVHMVSDKVITKSVEMQHLQTPDYWLTCVLISIMAWKNDDRELADRAMARAIKLDKKESAVFYMLFNLRMGRDEAALKWFYSYQECELKGSDQRTFLMLFSLVSRTLTDHVSDSAKNAIFAFIRKVMDENVKASWYSEEDIINQIRQYINRMQPSDQLEYSMLRKYCTEFDRMAVTMMQAKNNINILEFILRTVHVPDEQKNTFLKGYIDELIAAPNQAEKDVYDEIAYNELVIRYEGDVETAKEVFSAEQTKKANDLNLITEMIDWIYDRETQEINDQIRLNTFTLTKELQESAVDAHVKAYRNRHKTVHNIKIGEYSAEVNFNCEEEEYSKVDSYFNEKCEEAVSAIKNWKALIGFGVGIASGVGAFFAGYWLFIVTLLGAVCGAGILISNKSQIKHLKQKCAENVRTTSDVLQKLFAEFHRYQAEFEEYDSYYERIKNEFNKI